MDKIGRKSIFFIKNELNKIYKHNFIYIFNNFFIN